ncbi:hypothetical protein TNCV_4020831 [Trichonephila clavipes]|nr:hypothetical protein TNCV_4020831 [Trichonephila clavipes]
MTTIVPHQIIGYGMEARFASHMPSKLTEGTESTPIRFRYGTEDLIKIQFPKDPSFQVSSSSLDRDSKLQSHSLKTRH